jgi:predicted peptidase
LEKVRERNLAGRLPYILFLHGAGEKGTDGEKQVGTGLGKAIRNDKDFPFIAVFPQAEMT